MMTAMTLGALSQAIRCTFPSCKCECFSSSKTQIRTCQNCKHGWVTHALDKLLATSLYPGMPVQAEQISPSIVFDIASLVLYDCQAIPIRIKFCLDRLFSALQHDEVLQILHGFGWSYEDYARGYILQDPTGRVQEKWSIVLREEEMIILQQFLRFSETRNIAQELLLQENKSLNETSSPTHAGNVKSESDIRKFMERNNMALIQSYNLALRRAFDNPQSLFSAMGTFPSPHMNMAAAAAAASQLGRPFQPHTGMLAMPTAGFPQSAAAKAEPITTAEQINRKVPEPYDLSNKRSPESQKSTSPTLNAATTPLGFNGTGPINPTMDSRSFPELNACGNAMKKSSSPLPNLVRRPTSPASSNKGWPFNNPSFGQTVFVTSSGKKRVLCTACNKTFCDKGALKIHYSAVHLKEMHQCTIPGCNMMFSSRRSRNRHSANPNPKLHTPQTRRPRERYDTAQDQMLAMMGMRPGPKSTDDGGSSMDESEAQGDKSREYLAGADKSLNGSEDGQLEEDFVDDDMDDGLPTQVKLRQDCPLYGSSKRKRLMPTRVTTSVEPNAITADDDIKSENGKSVVSDSPSMDDSLDVGDGSEPISQNMFIRDESEPGEVKNGSPVEPGEVIRHGDEKHFLAGFPPSMESPDKQTSAMQTLFSSLLPNGEHAPSDFWSNFIQQTAAAKKMAQRLVEQREEDKSLKHETYKKESAESSQSESKPRCQSDKSSDGSGNEHTNIDCDYCDKSFLSNEALARHRETVHRGQDTMYPDKTATYPNYIDSLKNKTPLVA